MAASGRAWRLKPVKGVLWQRTGRYPRRMSTKMTRRNVLGLGAAGLASTVAGFPGLALAQTKPARQPKNLIYMVSDGMSMGVPSMLDHYLQIEHGKGSVWAGMMRGPEFAFGWMDTRSLSSLVTDSAAASSAWGSGVHCWNGQINTLADGTALRPVYDILKAAGMKLGLVTTTTITHATPAGFAISVPSRDREEEIAVKYLEAGYDVYLGGGDRFFAAAKRKDQRDLYGDFANAGYTVVKDRAALKSAAKIGKLLGVFSDGQVPYTIDQLNMQEVGAQTPPLAEMMLAALDRLKGSPKGFALQVEGGRVDHAAHGNDFCAILHDQWAFDQAVEAALAFAEADGDTLVVVTSDHANSNPGLVGAGSEYGEATDGLKRFSGMKASYDEVFRAIDPAKGAESVRSVVEAKLGVELTVPQADFVLSAMQKKSALGFTEHYDQPSSALGLALGAHTHVCWSGRQHTSDYTPISAAGPGQEMFRGLVDNVAVFSKILGLFGLSHKNPSMTFEDAQRAMEKQKAVQLSRAVEGHWA